MNNVNEKSKETQNQIPVIDMSLMPPLERRLLGKAGYEAMQLFYENPENVRRYKEWEKEQQAGGKNRRE